MELNASDALETQGRYARWLTWGTRLGFALLVVGFGAYAFGVAPQVPLEKLPELWHRPSAELLAETGLQPGWHWVSLLPRSDMLVMAAIGVLASCSIPCLAAVMPIFLARGERVLAAVCVLEIAVLALAASGVLSVH